MYNAGKYACTFDENTYITGISTAPPENAKSTKIRKKGFLNMIKFNFLKSLWLWLIVLIIFSFGIILYTINKNKSNNILILSTIRPITLALDNILDGIPNVEIKEIRIFQSMNKNNRIDDNVINDYLNNVATKNICNKYNISASNFYRILKRNNIKTKYK